MLNFLRNRTSAGQVRGQRLWHVFGSQVPAGVVAKGRSSFRVVNRMCRRLWTLSRWQHSDAASRFRAGDFNPETRARGVLRYLTFVGSEPFLCVVLALISFYVTIAITCIWMIAHISGAAAGSQRGTGTHARGV